ncbi:hypothetical protein J2S11_003443 [Bacillus horti]|uniref:DUF1259 domain-containing protein n=1 Tax=Caldalkalibacillus horti TaxID=77523 RepID=A0ABT9W2P5_9BACI|nr:hypothetical protein [Bacillus horti]
MSISTLCREFAAILEATPSQSNGVCLAQAFRTNIRPTILGRKSRSPLTIPQFHSFENLDRNGRALCLGETVILTAEINPFISKLRKHGILVTALHNHWLFANPNIWYIHYEKIERPLTFARAVRDAKTVLTRRIVKPLRIVRAKKVNKLKRIVKA